jgi:hypothetical protein
MKLDPCLFAGSLGASFEVEGEEAKMELNV